MEAGDDVTARTSCLLPGSGSHRRAASSLAGVYCEAECRDMMAGPDGRDRHSCAVSGHALDAFYCSPQVIISRVDGKLGRRRAGR